MLPATGSLEIRLGEILVERDDLAEASVALARGLDLLRSSLAPDPTTRGYVARARLAYAGGDITAAFVALVEGEAWCAQMQLTGRWLSLLPTYRARLQVWSGDLEAAVRWANDYAPVGELLSDYAARLTLVRLRMAQHERRPDAQTLAAVHTELQAILHWAQAGGRYGLMIEPLVLQTLALQAQGETERALAALARALALAAPEGYVRVFADEGPPLAALLREGLGASGWGAAGDMHDAGIDAYAHHLLAILNATPLDDLKG